MRCKIIILLTVALVKVGAKTDTISELYKIAVSIKQCLINKYPVVCLKQRALEALNESTFTNEPIMLGYIRIEKNNEYDWNQTIDNTLPVEISKRSIKLSDALYDKIQEFFKSRTIRLNIDEAFKGRKKGGGGGGGGGGGKGGKGLMLLAGAAACLGAGIMVGKMGMMAMGAMMMSKMAMMMSAILILKKMKPESGGEEPKKEKQIKIVYATTGGGDYGKGGGGGGYHRSLNVEPQTISYRAHVPQDVNSNVVYEGY